MDQVGVNAPGRPMRRTDLDRVYDERLTFFGGNPEWSSTEGSCRLMVQKDIKIETR